MLLEELIFKHDLDITNYFSDLNNIKKFFKENENTNFYYSSNSINNGFISTVFDKSEINELKKIPTHNIPNIYIEDSGYDIVVIIKKIRDNYYLVFSHILGENKNTFYFVNNIETELSITRTKIPVNKETIIKLNELRNNYIFKYFRKYKKTLFLDQFAISIFKKSAIIKNFEILHESKIQLVFRIPEIIIRNSLDLSLNTGSWLINISKSHIKFRYSVIVYRESMTTFEKQYSYFHSHYNSIPTNLIANLFNFCLGDHYLQNFVSNRLLIIDSIYNAKTLVSNIYNYLSWESIEGGPYTALSNLYIKYATTKIIDRINTVNFVNSIIKSFFKNFLEDTENLVIEFNTSTIIEKTLEDITLEYKDEFINYILNLNGNNEIERRSQSNVPLIVADGFDNKIEYDIKIIKGIIFNTSIINNIIGGVIRSILSHFVSNYNITNYIQKIVIDNLILYTTLEHNNTTSLKLYTTNQEEDYLTYRSKIISMIRSSKNNNKEINKLLTNSI